MLNRFVIASLIGLMTMMASETAAFASFTDVPRGHWAYDAVSYLESEGLVTGYPDGTFRGDKQLTRYEFAMVVSRLYDQFLEMVDNSGASAPPIDTQAIMTMLMSEFESEFDDLRALIVGNIERIENLETTSGQTTTAVNQLTGRIDAMDSRFKPFGDLRLRFEGKYPDTGLQTQRPRYRLRWGFTSAITPELTFGARFASGEEGGITSTNETIDDAFGFDVFTIDRAYLQYKPASVHGFTLWGGKFSPPWVNTPLVWDSDAMVEGLAQHYKSDNFNFYLGELIPSKEGYYLVAQAGADDLFVDGLRAYVTYHYINDKCWQWIQADMESGKLRNRMRFDVLNDMDDYRAFEVYGSYTGNAGDMPFTIEGNYLKNLEGTAEDAESGWQQAAWAQLSIGNMRNPGDWKLSAEWGKAQANSVLSWLTDADRGSGDHEWWGTNWSYRLMKNTDFSVTYLSIDRISKDSSEDIIQVDISTKF